MIVYCITNRQSGRRYVGITVSTVRVRWQAHLRSARKGVKTALYDAIRSYGRDAFDVEVIANLIPGLTRADLCEVERTVIAQEATKIPNGYNMTDGGDGGPNYHPSAERIESAKRLLASPEVAAKRRAALRGRALSDEHKDKIRLGMIGKNVGKLRTQEYRDRMSDMKKGVPNPHKGKPLSPEVVERMKAAWASPERRAEQAKKRLGLTAPNKGQTWSDAQRRKIADIWTTERREKQASVMSARRIAQTQERRIA